MYCNSDVPAGLAYKWQILKFLNGKTHNGGPEVVLQIIISLFEATLVDHSTGSRLSFPQPMSMHNIYSSHNYFCMNFVSFCPLMC